MKRACACCGDLFQPRHNGQWYCSKKSCQRKRKSMWQQKKLSTDAAYRANQTDAQRLWRKKNPDYMRRYRQSHPGYVEHNREMQRRRRLQKLGPLLPAVPSVVKMDVRSSQPPVVSGTYTLLPVGVVKMDAITVQLSVLQ
jgi:hypothetical protein